MKLMYSGEHGLVVLLKSEPNRKLCRLIKETSYGHNGSVTDEPIYAAQCNERCWYLGRGDNLKDVEFNNHKIEKLTSKNFTTT